MLLCFVIGFLILESYRTEEKPLESPIVLNPIVNPNGISTMDRVNSTFRVLNRSFNDELGVTNTGTAFIFEEDENYSYLLTNAHVVKIQQGYTNNQISVLDYNGIKSDAFILEGSYQEQLDLAILVIDKVNHQPIEIKDVTVNLNDEVVSIGYYPTAQVTYGHITSLNRIDYIVNMVVIGHTASILPGASGGPVFNSNLELIGINYSNVTSNGEFIRAYSIPVSTIKNYINDFFRGVQDAQN